jgi:predicted HD phosphohydrolase
LSILECRMELSMTKITEFAQLAVRAADLADRCEAAGALVVAALLREIAQEVRRPATTVR